MYVCTCARYLFRVNWVSEFLELSLGKQFVGGVSEEHEQFSKDTPSLFVHPLELLFRQLPRFRGRGHRQLLVMYSCVCVCAHVCVSKYVCVYVCVQQGL